MLKVLLTGGSGYIGGEILALMNERAQVSLSQSLDIYAVYRQDGHAIALKKVGCKAIKLDLTDLEAVKSFIKEEKIEVVVELTDPFGTDLASACIEALKQVSSKATLISTGGAKLFASFSGYDTTQVLYDDDNPLDPARTPHREWPVSELAQANYRKILETAKAQGVSAHIVIPPIVYGQSRTFGNPISIQVAGLCKALIHYGRPLVISGSNDLPQTYAICHVEDIANMYVVLLRNILAGNSPSSGVYFAENGVVDWTRLVKAFAEGLNIPGEVEMAGNQEMKELVGILGVQDETWVRPWIGGRTNISGRAGRKIGWSPRYDVDHMYAVASEEARHMSRHLK